jgi:hypothetical protein
VIAEVITEVVAMASALRTDPQQEFLALLCEDEDLLRAEFEAIIDANWDRPGPLRPTPSTPPAHPGPGWPPVATTIRSGSARGTYAMVWCRMRSPPHDQ